ncbi:hypothetical protein HA402_000473 [Bradysia odoriphaga]|nr:hypothetical protein HA402_000473 [Bradysia odoriphaga]
MLKGKVTFKILKEGYSVLVESLEAHSTLKRFLSQQKIPFYTFATSDNKPLRLVLKGVHHSYTPEEIVEDLTAKKVNVVNVQQMYGKGKINLDMFIVNFEQGTNTSATRAFRGKISLKNTLEPNAENASDLDMPQQTVDWNIAA